MPESTKLRQPVDPLYQNLREGKADEFNSHRNGTEPYDLHSCDPRGIDLRRCNVGKFSFSDSYFRLADLHGVDPRKCPLDGASLQGAHVTGAYFSDSIDTTEIDISARLGTRIRRRQG